MSILIKASQLFTSLLILETPFVTALFIHWPVLTNTTQPAVPFIAYSVNKHKKMYITYINMYLTVKPALGDLPRQ